MARAVIFEWEGREYEHEPKSGDWYWALGIIATAAFIAALLFGEYLVALLIAVAAIVLALHATKKPPLHRFRITDDGLVIGSDLHPYGRMRSFSMLEHIDGEFPPYLSIKTESWLTPHLLIPLHDSVDADALYAHFLERVDEAEHPPTFSDLVGSWLGL